MWQNTGWREKHFLAIGKAEQEMAEYEYHIDFILVGHGSAFILDAQANLNRIETTPDAEILHIFASIGDSGPELLVVWRLLL